jgi:hypothetical protein
MPENFLALSQEIEMINNSPKRKLIPPYLDGPHIIETSLSGTQTRRKWYGFISDGFVPWASVLLYENFGFHIHEPVPRKIKTPLNLTGDGDFDAYSRVPPWLSNFYSLPNLAIAMSYFCIGIALQLLRTPLIVYFIVDLDATAAQVNVLFTVMAIPWCFKVFYGFLSDLCPINGEYRKPYLIIGWAIYVFANLVLWAIGNPSIGVTLFWLFVQTSAYILADVSETSIETPTQSFALNPTL